MPANRTVQVRFLGSEEFMTFRSAHDAWLFSQNHKLLFDSIEEIHAIYIDWYFESKYNGFKHDLRQYNSLESIREYITWHKFNPKITGFRIINAGWIRQDELEQIITNELNAFYEQ